LFLADDDQVPAVEPRFHREPPQSSGTVVMSLRRFVDHRSELFEEQSKNGLALAFSPVQMLSLVIGCRFLRVEWRMYS
jgi:hypothetical protein